MGLAARDVGAGSGGRRRQPDSAFTPEQLEVIRIRMRARGFRTHVELADALGVSDQTVSRWFGRKRGASLPVVTRLAEVLDVPLLVLRVPDAAVAWLAQLRAPSGTLPAARAIDGRALAVGGPPSDDLWNVEPQTLVEPPAAGARRWPIYEWAAAGDPVAPTEGERPTPVDWRVFEGAPDVIGRRGFGMFVRGTSMSNWDFADGDLLWINPSLEPRLNKPGLWLVRLNGECGPVAKVLREDRATGRRWLESDGDNGPGVPIPYEEVRYLGHIVKRIHEEMPRRKEDAQRLERAEQAALRDLNRTAPPERASTPPTPLRDAESAG